MTMKEPIPVELRWAIWERDDFRCKHCGTRRFLAVDHIIAESNGGTLDPANLQTLCRSCNSRKGRREVGTVRVAIQLRRDSDEKKMWWAMCQAWPPIHALWKAAASYRKYARRSPGEFCANAIWYSDLKPRLVEMVGYSVMERKNVPDVLKSTKAYDVAYDRIYHALPDCSHTGSCWWGLPVRYSDLIHLDE
jgi:hypothetical protein